MLPSEVRDTTRVFHALQEPVGTLVTTATGKLFVRSELGGWVNIRNGHTFRYYIRGWRAKLLDVQSMPIAA